MGCFDAISMVPPRCMRKVRSDTLWTVTPSSRRSTSTISSACCMSVAAQVTSIWIRSWPDALTSSAVTAPPTRSTAAVRRLIAEPPAGSSRRTTIE
jgi:hypothetical protein